MSDRIDTDQYPEVPSKKLKRRTLEALEELDEWKPAQRLLEKWAPKVANITERSNRRRFSVVAVTGGVKVGKSTVANRIVGSDFSSVNTRPETDHAVIAKPPTLSSRELEKMFSHSSPEVHDVEMREWPEDVVLVDTPDFDSDRDDNADTARQIISHADVVVVVGSQEKSYSSRQLDWCQKWTDTKTFLFVHNTGGDAKQIQDIEAEKDRQRRNLQKQGFNADNIFCIDIDEDVRKIRRAVWQSGTQSYEIQQSQLLQCVVGMTRDFEREYENAEGDIEELKDTIDARVIEPWREQMEEYGFTAESDAFVRELTFGSGQRIGGPLGAFLRLRRYFDPIGFTGLIAQKFVPSRAGKTIVTAGSALMGLAKRMVQSWTDKQALKGKKITKGELPQADEETMEELEKSARRAGFRSDWRSVQDVNRDRKELQNHASEVIDEVMDEEIRRQQRWVDSGLWKLLWNLPPLAAMGHVIYRAGGAFLGYDSVGASFYLHAIIIFVVILWGESWMLSRLFRRRSRVIGNKVIERFLSGSAALGGGYNRLVERLEKNREQLRNIREDAEEYHETFAETIQAEGLSTPQTREVGHRK